MGRANNFPKRRCLSRLNATSLAALEELALRHLKTAAHNISWRRLFLAREARRSNNRPARSCSRTTTRGSDMRNSTVIALFSCLLAASSASADQPLDCSKKSLSAAVADLHGNKAVIEFTGTCTGPIV